MNLRFTIPSALLAAVIPLVGCLDAPIDSPQVTQQGAKQPSVCDATMPVILPWDGTPPPAGGPRGVYVAFENTPGEFIAGLANLDQRQVIWATKVDASNLGQLALVLGQTEALHIPKRPPPPPDELGPWVVAMAERFSATPDEAEADLGICLP